MFTLQDLLVGTHGTLVGGSPTGVFQRVCIDSRHAQPGDLFVALRGERDDGHTFVPDALRRGAAGVLVDTLAPDQPWAVAPEDTRPIVLARDARSALIDLASHWRRTHEVRVVGVTGSVGKTTTKEVVAQLVAQRFCVLRSPGNFNTDVGIPLSMMEIEPRHEVAVLEMGMYGVGEIEKLAAITIPEVGIVTNVLPIHLERLGSLDRIAQAKGELVRSLPARGLALLNADDERARKMAAWCPGRTLLYGTSPEADLRAIEVRSLKLRGIECVLGCEGQRATVQLQLLGKHSVYAALAALGVALYLGIEFPEAVRGLAAVAHGPRLTVLSGRSGCVVIDDTYNASPPATLAALDVLAEMEGRRIAVLGDMLELGSFEEEGHRLVGRRAAQAADCLVTVGTRARLIADEAVNHGMPSGRVERLDAPSEAIERLASMVRPNDFVLVKASRAMELEVIVEALRDSERPA